MKKMRRLLRELVCTGAILPGSITRQYNVCGIPGCRCKDKKDPRKHGPYFQISYGAKGKSSSMFVREPDIAVVEEMTGNYRNVRDITIELGHEVASLCREKGFAEGMRIYNEIFDIEKRRSIGVVEREAESASSGTIRWKERASERTASIERTRIESRDLRLSRDKWRNESLSLRKKLKEQDKLLKRLEEKNIRVAAELKKKRLRGGEPG